MENQIILLFILLVLSGFFSSSETALFSISRIRIRHMAKQDGQAFKLIEKMRGNPHKLLTTILIGNNLVNVAAATVATSITMDYFPHYALGIATGIMTFLILVFGEVLPKSVATRNNILIAKLTIYPIYWLSVLFYPISVFLNFIPKLTEKIKKTPTATEEELMTFVEVVEEEGEIKEEEKEFIHNIFELDDKSAAEIMTPRADMFVIDVNEKLDLETIAKSGFTRIPVIEGDIDHVIGILNIKDLFSHLAAGNTEINVRKIMTKPYFVPENKKLDQLLHQFKRRKHHMAIVVDEHGVVSGLITLEDALEEIVGEIRDETDKEEPNIVQRRSNEWIVLGKTDIDEINQTIGMDIPDTNEYDTFSGFILDKIGRIPAEKEEIRIDGFLVTVE
ncbi:MAG: HlyC/CorC family transporter, partial [Deltaproteobacteria bacterium]|nr:HlyC/CorC family transporter [Deltaproteobacteria bacterium]